MDLFPVYVVVFAASVIALLAAWVGIIGCVDLMREAWQAMKGREWKWPEGTNGVYGPGEQPPLTGPGAKPPRETFTTGRARNGDAP